eukprot:3545305-Rhodomonas_salina.1
MRKSTYDAGAFLPVTRRTVYVSPGSRLGGGGKTEPDRLESRARGESLLEAKSIMMGLRQKRCEGEAERQKSAVCRCLLRARGGGGSSDRCEMQRRPANSGLKLVSDLGDKQPRPHSV